jgi:hypothetical protein
MAKARFVVLIAALAVLAAVISPAQAQTGSFGIRGGYPYYVGIVGSTYFGEFVGIRATLDLSFPSGALLLRSGSDLLIRIPTGSIVEPYVAVGPAALLVSVSGSYGFAFAAGAVLGLEVVAAPGIAIAGEGGIDLIFGTSMIVQPKGHLGVNFRF